MDSKFNKDLYPEFSCRKCGEPTASTAGGLCHNCQRQDVIDREPWLDDPNDPINWPAPPGHLNDEEQRQWLDDYAAGMIAEEPQPQYSEFALIGCSTCGATGQELMGGVCPECLLKENRDFKTERDFKAWPYVSQEDFEENLRENGYLDDNDEV